MMGPTKLSTMRAEVRKAFRMTDAKLLAWFNRQMEMLAQKPRVNEAEIGTLRLLRDALIKNETKKSSGGKRRGVSGRSKS